MINKTFNTSPIILHACGRLEFCYLWKEAIQKRIVTKQELPTELTIVTFNNGFAHNGKIAGTFEKSLLENNLSHMVLGTLETNWKNSLKIPLLLSALEKIKTKFILIADSSDVLLMGNIKDLIPKFLMSNCKALFNAEKQMWPKNLCQDFETKLSNNHFPFLNAGLWIAYTDFAKEILEYCNSLKFESQSEQIYYKAAYKKFHPDLKIDCECTIFQNINRVMPGTIDF